MNFNCRYANKWIDMLQCIRRNKRDIVCTALILLSPLMFCWCFRLNNFPKMSISVELTNWSTGMNENENLCANSPFTHTDADLFACGAFIIHLIVQLSNHFYLNLSICLFHILFFQCAKFTHFSFNVERFHKSNRFVLDVHIHGR